MLFQEMLASSSDFTAQIYEHPYNNQLYKGSLPSKKFFAYLKEDLHYLHALSDSFLEFSKRFSQEEYRGVFEFLANYLKEAEIWVLDNFLKNPKHPSFFAAPLKDREKKNAITEAYIKHFQESCRHPSLAVGLASFIPCFYTYFELGKRMDLKKCPADNPYRDWIGSFSSKEYLTAYAVLSTLFQTLSQNIKCPQKQQEIIDAFKKSVEYELGFYDAAFFLTEEKQQTLVAAL